MYEVYSFCRLVDDIADEGGSRPERHRGLAEWRADIDRLYAGGRPPAGLAGLAEAIRAFDLRREDFIAVIDGMDMDVVEDIRAPDWATLELYCDRVASAVGRLSVRIFGTPEAEREGLAHHLGKALQLTNILRDVDEDAAIGRLYLPAEALAAAGITARDPEPVVADARLAAACAPVIVRARDALRRGGGDHGALPARHRAGPAASWTRLTTRSSRAWSRAASRRRAGACACPRPASSCPSCATA